MSSWQPEEVTAAEIGYSGQEQIDIMLHRIVELGGTAQMRDLYEAMEAVLNPQGCTLSFQGKSSARFFINRRAVEEGYVYPHDRANPGWRITPKGRARVQSSPAPVWIPEETAEHPDEPSVSEPLAESRQEPDEFVAVEPVVDQAPEPGEIKGLLGYVDQLLGGLPEIDAEHLLDPDSTTLFREGPPQDIQNTVRALMEFAHPGEVSLKLTLNSDGWHVVLHVHPRKGDENIGRRSV
jgi:hypothetical protein